MGGGKGESVRVKGVSEREVKRRGDGPQWEESLWVKGDRDDEGKKRARWMGDREGEDLGDSFRVTTLEDLGDLPRRHIPKA